MRKPRTYIRVLCVLQKAKMNVHFVIDSNHIDVVEYELTAKSQITT
jgi:hypothetical protein